MAVSNVSLAGSESRSRALVAAAGAACIATGAHRLDSQTRGGPADSGGGILGRQAGAAEEAIQALRLDMKFDLAFLDVEGDQGAGFQLAHTIRKHRPAVRVVLAAGVPRAAAEAGELCEQGPTQRKPYDHRTLERHIRRLLAR